MKTKLLKLVRKEATTVIFDMDSGNMLYGYELSSKIRANVTCADIEKGVYERRRLRREHIEARIKTLRASGMFRTLWVIKNSLK